MANLPALLRDIATAVAPRRKAYSIPSSSGGGWTSLIREPFAGAWQRNLEVDRTLAETYWADFSCKTLIARDIAKLGIRLVQEDADGIWNPVNNPAYSPVLRRPNHYQTPNQFWEQWILSKLSRGNTYVLKARDARHVVVALYVLDPRRVQPLIAEDGSVFYRLYTEQLAGLPSDVTVPATEIVHDRMNCLYHPLVGVPSIFASGMAAMQGLNIQAQAIRLFKNNANPGGILTAPGEIHDDTANRIKADWHKNFGGENYGSVAVLGDGLKFEKMALTAVEGQLIEQLKWTAQVICSVHHVPAYKIGAGELPKYDNIQALNVEYYTQCLQSLIEDAEKCLDEGLGLGEQYHLGTEFDVENLLRMDLLTQMDALEKGKNYLTPNDGRKRLNLRKVAGGDSVYRQQQDFSLEALAKRDAQDDPFAQSGDKPPAPAANDDQDLGDEAAKHVAAGFLQKSLDEFAA